MTASMTLSMLFTLAAPVPLPDTSLPSPAATLSAAPKASASILELLSATRASAPPVSTDESSITARVAFWMSLLATATPIAAFPEIATPPANVSIVVSSCAEREMEPGPALPVLEESAMTAVVVLSISLTATEPAKPSLPEESPPAPVITFMMLAFLAARSRSPPWSKVDPSIRDVVSLSIRLTAKAAPMPALPPKDTPPAMTSISVMSCAFSSAPPPKVAPTFERKVAVSLSIRLTDTDPATAIPFLVGAPAPPAASAKRSPFRSAVNARSWPSECVPVPALGETLRKFPARASSNVAASLIFWGSASAMR